MTTALKTMFRLSVIVLIWAVAIVTEMALLFAGLVSQGHDKGRLITIALLVVLTPSIAYGLHIGINHLFGVVKRQPSER